MAVSYTDEALQGILRASATFHTQSLDLSKKNIETLPEYFPVLQNLLVLKLHLAASIYFGLCLSLHRAYILRVTD